MISQKRISLWFSAVLIVVILGLGAYFAAISPNTEPPRQDGTMSPALDPNDRTKGSTSTKVTLTEYSDFQCPACGLYYPMVEEMFAEYKDRISFTYRHFPLPKHKNALPAAYASEAAGIQGKFWEMTDMLFKNQAEWSEGVTTQIIFEKYAKEIGIDVARYKIDVKSEAVKNKIERDIQSGIASAINHTPTFFINGKLSDNPRSLQELKALIEYAITHP